MTADILRRAAAELGIAIDSSQADALLAFAALLRRWNAVFNLVSRRDERRIIERHVLDAVSLARWVRGGRVIDLGTGAGFPGLPLAVVVPEARFTLIDRNERRIRFVRQASHELGLSNVLPITSDFADFSSNALFDTVVSRAVGKPDQLWRVAAALLKSDGQALFQTGAQEVDVGSVEAEVERHAIRVPGLDRPHHVLRVTRSRAETGPR